MAGRRRLPLVTEQSLASLRQIRTQLASDFDRELSRTLTEAKMGVSCRVGCTNCCFHPVLITAIEGAVIYRWLAERGRWTPSLQARVREHSTKTTDLPFEVWFLSVIPCPLLDQTTKKCSIYQGRPYTCRVTYALGDPENCHPHKILESSIVNKQPVLATYHKEQNKIAKKHGLQMVLMPLSLAILIGEKIVNAEIDIENADMAVLKEFGAVR